MGRRNGTSLLLVGCRATETSAVAVRGQEEVAVVIRARLLKYGLAPLVGLKG